MEFDSVGSGSIFAKESLKKSFVPGASRDQVIRTALESLTDAADEDRATGGVDLLREIYPRIKLVTENGIEDVGDDEIAQVYQDILAARRRPSTGA